jgi:copper(I)-binding protein
MPWVTGCMARDPACLLIACATRSLLSSRIIRLPEANFSGAFSRDLGQFRMPMHRSTWSILLFACCWMMAMPASAAEKMGLVVKHPWAPPAAVMTSVPVYMSITSDSGTADRLISATTPIAARAELHASTTENEIVGMRQLDAIEVPAHGPALLKPGRSHLMLITLKSRLTLHDSFPLRLVFAQAGPIDVMVTIKKVPPWEHDHASSVHRY